MAHNGEAGGSGGGVQYKSCLTTPEAAFFAEHCIPMPLGVRLPSGGGWAVSAMGYVVPPYPEIEERVRALARARRRTLAPEQLEDPSYTEDGPLWHDIFALERMEALNDGPLVNGSPNKNSKGQRRWWRCRSINDVLRKYGFVPPWRQVTVPWLSLLQ